MDIVTAAAPPFFENGYLVTCEETLETVIIDPGDGVDDLIEHATAERLKVTMILLTHAHLDHVSGVERAKAAFGAPSGCIVTIVSKYASLIKAACSG
jgi:glyoxylase-like metal-dependent hydrolase (beta-lactamase superfamily II)